MVKTSLSRAASMLVALLAVASCSGGKHGLFIPARPVQENLPVREQLHSATDKEVLADLLTVVLRREAPTLSGEPLQLFTDSSLAVHPEHGPFLFTNGSASVIAYDATFKSGQTTMPMAAALLGSETPLFTAAFTPGTDSIRVTRLVREPAPKDAARRSSLHKVPLRPRDLAQELSRFKVWTGAQIDPQTGALILLGREDGATDPPISDGDLVTAYNAIFRHEAAGEPLFVDMDPGETYSNYLVSFGGGFEDTHLGKVLFESDILLKALSSGIDPWTKHRPLHEEYCAQPQKTTFQVAFCDHLRPFLAAQGEAVREDVHNAVRNAQRISALRAGADKSDPDCWAWVFHANPFRAQQIRQQVMETGHFTLNDGGLFLYPSRQGYCCAVDKSADPSKQRCEPQRTLKVVDNVLNLGAEDRVLMTESQRWPEGRDRTLYVELASASPSIHRYLLTSNPETRQLFSFMHELGSFGPQVSLAYLLAEQPRFRSVFLTLSEEERRTLAFLSGEMLWSKQYEQFILNLQYHQPLCAQQKTLPLAVHGATDAYLRFVCGQLAKHPRPYLADLIRKDLGAAIPYKASHEIKSVGQSYQRERIQIRYWFHPEYETLVLSPDGNTFLFSDTRLRASAERLGERRGPSSPDRDYYSVPGLRENLEQVNASYDALAEIFPALKELRQVVKLLSFFRWLRGQHQGHFDLTAFEHASDPGTPTPRHYPVLETTVALPGSFLQLSGGVDLHSPSKIRVDNARTAALLSAQERIDSAGRFAFDGQSWRRSEPIRPRLQGRMLRPTREYARGAERIKLWSDSNELEIGFYRTEGRVRTEHQRIDGLNRWERAVSTVGNPGLLRERFQNGQLIQQWTWQQDGLGYHAQQTRPRAAAPSSWSGTVAALCAGLRAELPTEVLWAAEVRLRNRDIRLAELAEGLLLQPPPATRESALLLSRTQPPGRPCNLRSLPPDEVRRLTQTRLLPPVGASEKVVQVALDENAARSFVLTDLATGRESKIDLSTWWGALRGEKQQARSTLPIDLSPATTTDTVFISDEHGSSSSPQIDRRMTERRFLAESIAAARQRMLREPEAKSPRYLLAYGGRWERAHSVLSRLRSRPVMRVVIVDPEGIPQATLDHLRELGRSSDRLPLLIFHGAPQSALPAASEIIWLTMLPGPQIASRLKLAQAQRWIPEAARLRVWNLHNSVLDLGAAVARQGPALSAIGAWPHAVRPETALPVLAELMQRPISSELDIDMARAVQIVHRRDIEMPSAHNLQVSHERLELLAAWEALLLTPQEAWTVVTPE